MIDTLRELLFERASLFTRGDVVGLFGLVEIAAWCVLGVAAVVVVVRTRGLAGVLDRWDAALSVAALVARLVVPHDNYNWYLAVGSAVDDASVYTRATYLPLPSRALGFWMSGGFDGIVGSNIALGTLAVSLFRHALLRLGVAPRAALAAAFLMALLPAYVRLSASDTSQIVVLTTWCIAALAWAEVRADRHRALGRLVVIAAIVAGALVRLESGALFGGFLLLGDDPWHAFSVTPGRVARIGPPLVVLAVMGGLTLLFHGTGADHVTSPEMVMLALALTPLRMIGAFDAGTVQYVPVLIAAPVLVHVIDAWRRDRTVLTATVGPLALLALPFVATSNVLATDLSSSSYSVLYLPFVLVAAGKGIDLAIERASSRLAWRALAVVVALGTIVSAWPAYGWQYVFQEEHRFLETHLPRTERGVVLTMFESHGESGDFDCCLALPYPPWLASHPGLRWRVLHGADLDGADLDDAAIDTLEFDYYYPSSLVQLDVDRATPMSLRDLLSLPADARHQADREMFVRMRRFDERVRAHFALEPIARERVRARWTPVLSQGTTGVEFGFSQDPTLVLYRRRRAASR